MTASYEQEHDAVEYSDGETCSFAYDAFLDKIAFSNDIAFANLNRDASGDCTNETALVGDEMKTTRRTFDDFRRLTGIDGTIYEYNPDGLLALISNDIAVVEYAYTPDRLDAGYTLTLSNGVVFTRSITRDGYRRSLVTDISSVANSVGVGSFAYAYDALNRPTARNNDTFGYNARSEVVLSRRGEMHLSRKRSGCLSGANLEEAARGCENAEDVYSYDGIGNLLYSSVDAVTNAYAANNLNQYATLQEISAPSAPLREIIHDADGNMTQCGDWTYTYDAANRLKTVSSNGVLLVTNFYDAKSRRVKKVTPEATFTFFYDGWNLIEERVAYTNGMASAIHYYWGKDLSGTLQGAGGVGGLLYLTIDGVPFIPNYDNNGNIMRYLDANGNIVVQYTYDAFGKTIAQSGVLAAVFRHRFSTKYYDVESGLYYYGYRFYSPMVMRWLNRDPIGVSGGLNLYGFCGNSAVSKYDKDGCAYFAKRRLSSLPWRIEAKDLPIGRVKASIIDGLADWLNVELQHEQLFMGDGTTYGWDKKMDFMPNEQFSNGYVRTDPKTYDDCIMSGCNEIFMQSQRVLAAENAKGAKLMPRRRPASGP